jgi:hypothetical protein
VGNFKNRLFEIDFLPRDSEYAFLKTVNTVDVRSSVPQLWFAYWVA